MKRSEYAKNLFLKGYNCSQSVLGAFYDLLEMSPDAAIRLGSSVGGGIARLRHTCGTVSAILMVVGAVHGYIENTAEAKSAHYAFVQDMMKAFTLRHGSIICKELLQLRSKQSNTVDNGTSPSANERTEAYYQSRPCLYLVEDATRFACEYLELDSEMPG